MLGERVGWVSRTAVFILKNKVKIWTVWPLHSSLSRALGGRVPACPRRLIEARDMPSS